jgi:hypothetical protein
MKMIFKKTVLLLFLVWSSSVMLLANEKPQTTDDVAVKDDGVWLVRPGYGHYYPPTYAFWIDLKIKDRSHDKKVGVLWSLDGFKTYQTAWARYEKFLGSDFEQWGVDVELPAGSFFEIEYATFIQAGGKTLWDRKNNHQLGAFKDQKVRVIERHVEVKEGQAFLIGKVKVQNIAYEKKVDVVYTFDSWKTTHTLPAHYLSGNDWDFAIPVAYPTPSKLELAVRYSVHGEEFWDNNNTANYIYQIGPYPQIKYADSDLLSGYEFFAIVDDNINPHGTTEVYLNDSLYSADQQNYAHVYLDTQQLAGDRVKVKLKVVDSLGFTTTTERTFNLDRKIGTPRALLGQDVGWPHSTAIKNDTLVISDHDKPLLGVMDLRTGSIKTLPAETANSDADFTADGNYITLNGINDSKLTIYSPNGQKLKQIALEKSLIDLPVCIETTKDMILVGSYVDNKFIKLDYEGHLLGEIKMDYFHNAKIYEGALWVSTVFPSLSLQLYELDGKLRETVSLDAQNNPWFGLISFIDDFAVSDQYIAILSHRRVLLFDRAWNFISKWEGTGAEREARVAGQLDIGTSIALYGNKIYVTDFGNHMVHELTINQ